MAERRGVADGLIAVVDGAVGRRRSREARDDAATTLLTRSARRRPPASAAGTRRGCSATSPPRRSHSATSRRARSLLLYAADLAFRLRWEIARRSSRAHRDCRAPYVTTAMTFGLATGLSSDWLRTLFRFAPEPVRTPSCASANRERPGSEARSRLRRMLHDAARRQRRRDSREGEARARCMTMLVAAAGGRSQHAAQERPDGSRRGAHHKTRCSIVTCTSV